jgi:hypothetical protein
MQMNPMKPMLLTAREEKVSDKGYRAGFLTGALFVALWCAAIVLVSDL